MPTNSKTYAYILGAGASKPDGMPLTNEIIDKAFCNFGSAVDNRTNTNLFGTWEKEDVFTRIRPVFKLMDYTEKSGVQHDDLMYNNSSGNSLIEQKRSHLSTNLAQKEFAKHDVAVAMS